MVGDAVIEIDFSVDRPFFTGTDAQFSDPHSLHEIAPKKRPPLGMGFEASMLIGIDDHIDSPVRANSSLPLALRVQIKSHVR